MKWTLLSEATDNNPKPGIPIVLKIGPGELRIGELVKVNISGQIKLFIKGDSSIGGHGSKILGKEDFGTICFLDEFDIEPTKSAKEASEKIPSHIILFMDAKTPPTYSGEPKIISRGFAEQACKMSILAGIQWQVDRGGEDIFKILFQFKGPDHWKPEEMEAVRPLATFIQQFYLLSKKHS